MSPTSYQAAPPRSMTIANGANRVKSETANLPAWLLRPIGPSDDLSDGLHSGASGEADQSCVASNSGGDIDGPGSGERGVRHGVGDSHAQRGAVIFHVYLQHVSTAKIDAIAQRHRWTRRRCSIRIHASGVVAFMYVLEEVEFHSHARRNARRSSG